jgi:hypothetical protein
MVLGAFPVEEASAQGPIIRGLRNRLNDGKPLMPFVADIENAIKPQPPNRLSPAAKAAKQPTPAKAPSSADRPAPRTPTPASRPSPGKVPTPAGKEPQQKYPPIKLKSSDGRQLSDDGQQEEVSQKLAAAGFGMAIQQSGDSFFVSQIDPRGNAASAGLRTGDVIVNVGGAPIKVVAEYEAIGKAMRGGDRVEFEVSRRGSKPEKILVQFGQPEPIDENEEPNKIEVAPSYEPTPAAPTRRSLSDQYQPKAGSGLRSIYESPDKPSSILAPTPAPTPANRVESLELDLPALGGGK